MSVAGRLGQIRIRLVESIADLSGSGESFIDNWSIVQPRGEIVEDNEVYGGNGFPRSTHMLGRAKRKVEATPGVREEGSNFIYPVAYQAHCVCDGVDRIPLSYAPETGDYTTTYL